MLDFDYFKKKFYSLREEYLSSKPFNHILIDKFLPEDICDKVYNEFTYNKNNWTPYLTLNVKKYAYNNVNEMKHYTKTLINELNFN